MKNYCFGHCDAQNFSKKLRGPFWYLNFAYKNWIIPETKIN